MSKIADRPCICCRAESQPLDRWGWCPACVADMEADQPSADDIDAMSRTWAADVLREIFAPPSGPSRVEPAYRFPF